MKTASAERPLFRARQSHWSANWLHQSARWGGRRVAVLVAVWRNVEDVFTRLVGMHVFGAT